MVVLHSRGDEISCLPYATEVLKVPFIINVLRAGLEAALLLLSIIHLLSIEKHSDPPMSNQT